MSEMNAHATHWPAHVLLVEKDGDTIARAVLETDSTSIHGIGTAARNPADFEVEQIGEELAAGRALIDLGRRLLGLSEADIEALTGESAHVTEKGRG